MFGERAETEPFSFIPQGYQARDKKKQQQQLARMFALSHRHTLSFRYTPVHSTIATKNPYLPHSIPFHLTYIHPQCRRKNEFFLLPYQFIEANSNLGYIFYIEKKNTTHTHTSKKKEYAFISKRNKKALARSP